MLTGASSQLSAVLCSSVSNQRAWVRSLAIIVLLTGGCDALFGTSESDSTIVVDEQCPDPVKMYRRAKTGECACLADGYVRKGDTCVQCDDSCDNLKYQCGFTECGSLCGCSTGKSCVVVVSSGSTSGVCVPSTITKCKALMQCVWDCQERYAGVCNEACKAKASLKPVSHFNEMWSCIYNSPCKELPYDEQTPCANELCGDLMARCYADDGVELPVGNTGQTRPDSDGSSGSDGGDDDSGDDDSGDGGSGDDGGTDDGGSWSMVAMHDKAACALDAAGKIACWGEDPTAGVPPEKKYKVGLTSPPTSHTYVDVIMGSRTACGVDKQGKVYCWGKSIPSTTATTAKAPPGTLIDISVGYDFICAIWGDGASGPVTCWGKDSGFGVLDPPKGAFQQISAGRHFACGVVASDGDIKCWGQSIKSRPLSYPTSGYTAVAAAPYGFVCAIHSTQGAFCWGKTMKPPSGDFTQMSCGNSHCCGVGSTGVVECWGDDYSGGATDVPSWALFANSVACGDSFTCAVANGHLGCWGSNRYGEDSVLDTP